jgi:hypoxia up-regulated 1
MRSIPARSSSGCRTGKFPLSQFSSHIHLLTKSRLAAFDASDRARHAREEGLNNLEAFTYRARDYLDDSSFITSSTAEIRTKLEGLLSAASEWIYESGPDATEEVLVAKLKELKDLVDPVLNRKNEASKRPDAVKAFTEAVEGLKSVVPMVKEQIGLAAEASSKSSEEAAKSSASPSPSPSPSPEADPLADLEVEDSSSSSTVEAIPEPTEIPTIYTLEDLAYLETTISKSESWLVEVQGKQEKLQEHEDPAFTIQDLESETKKLNDAVMQMMMKKMKAFTPPKPKAKPKPKKPTVKKMPKATKKNKKDAESKDGESKGPSQAELDEALAKAGLKGEGIKFKNFGDMKDKDGNPLTKLDLNEGASEDDIKEAIDRAVREAKEAKEAQKESSHGDEL